MILRLYDVDKWHERHAGTNGDAMILRLYDVDKWHKRHAGTTETQ